MPDFTPLDAHKHAQVPYPVEELLLRRWSPRAFSTQPVTDRDLETIFTAGAWAASSYNEQPWRFLLGRKGEPAWQQIFDTLVPLNQVWAAPAPVLYASLAKKTFTQDGKPNRVAIHDVGAASANISLQAAALGLHTHGMAGFDAEKLRASFEVPDDYEPIACWALGYLGDPATLPDNLKDMELQARERKPLDAFVFRTWDKAAL